MESMKRVPIVLAFMQLLVVCVSSVVAAGEPALTLTEREIVERLTRLEEGQNTLRAEIQGVEQSLRAEIRANTEAIRQLRVDMNQLRADMNQLRTDIQAQFGQLIYLMVGVVGAFGAIVAVTIGFAMWDRRTMIRPFETKVKEIEEALSDNRQRLHSLLEALRTLSQTDERVAEVLRRFNLL
jgi:DNA repair exonuclease SbcCD ATPase subunit